MKAVREVILTTYHKSNQIKFKLDNAGSGYPVSRARGSCIMHLLCIMYYAFIMHLVLCIYYALWNLEVLVSKGDGIRLKISYNLQRYYATENIFHRALFFS